MIGQTGLVKAHPPLSHCVAYLGMVGFTVVILTYKPIGGVEDPAGLWVEVGAALPVPPKVAPPMNHTLTHLLFIPLIIFLFPILICIFLLLLTLYHLPDHL